MTRYVLFATFFFCTAWFAVPASAQTTNQMSSADPPIYTTKELDKRISVTSKPEPGYTVAARKHDVTGTVTLRCVFHASGKVTNIKVLTPLPDGLTEKAIEAAKQIKFIPAMKDGRPVSTYAVINYAFELYDREDDPAVTRKAVILEQPAVTYTEEAKAKRIEGTVVLNVSLARDGKSRVINVVQGLPHGLTEQAAVAVQGIKFTPAERSGRPTTVARQIV